MTKFMRRSTIFAGLLAFPLVAAAAPLVFADAKPGLWELSVAGSAKPPIKVCVKNILEVAAVEHGAPGSCTYRDLGGGNTTKRVNFTCSGGGFGQAVMTVITPRNLKVATQGLVDGAPYNENFQARRLGDC